MKKPLLPTPTLCGIMTVATWERLLSEDLDPFLRSCYVDWLEENPDLDTSGGIIVLKREDEARGWRELVKRGYVPTYSVSGENAAWCWFSESNRDFRCGWYQAVMPVSVPLVHRVVFDRLDPTNRASASAGAGYATSLEAEKDMVRVLAERTRP